MAELILTEEEKKSPSYLDWDDASLGKAVKRIAFLLCDNKGQKSISINAAVVILIKDFIETNASSGTIKIEGLTSQLEPLGDWEITLERTDTPPPAEEENG